MRLIFAERIKKMSLFHERDIFRLSFLVMSIGLGSVLTWLSYIGMVPVSIEYSLFYSSLLFLFALWRPNLAFLLFIIFLPLEIVLLTPAEWGVQIRPYQWVALLLGMALSVRMLTGKLHWPLFTPNWIDWSLMIFWLGVLIAGIFGGGVGFKQAMVVASFGYLYGLSRIFLRKKRDITQAVSCFVVSATGVLVWGLIQNILFLNNRLSWAVMPGRPNGTLPEPDWLGGLIVLLLMIGCGWCMQKLRMEEAYRPLVLPWLWVTSLFLMLILTVSRSAWLGALVALSVAAIGYIWLHYRKVISRRSLVFFICFLGAALTVALLIALIFPLTRFQLFDRALSTASHDQTITIACDRVIDLLPDSVSTVEELSKNFGCTHITLEERALQESQGRWVTTIKRPDPNVHIRSDIYRESIATIREHPWLGIGWGNIGAQLGTDERGASFNASNMWLEIWLGGGVIAIGGFFLALVWMVSRYIRELWKNPQDEYSVLLLASMMGFLVFNLFNAGLLLGYVWVYFALFSFQEEDKLAKNTSSA